MLTYELAKELRDNGYPQDECDGYFEYGEERQIVTKKQMNDFAKNPIGMLQLTEVDSYYCPTLSELIEACENELVFTLMKQSEWHAATTNTWIASAAVADKVHGLTEEAIRNAIVNAYGATAIEAVANLWLELNKK